MLKFRTAAIWSEDLHTNLLPFYRDVVGLPVAMESDRYVILGDMNAPSLALGSHSEVHGKAKEPLRHMVGFDVDDIRSEAGRLKSKGVEFRRGAERAGRRHDARDVQGS